VFCKTETKEKMSYNILLDSTSQPFGLAPLLSSWEGTIYSTLVKELEELQDQGFWQSKDGAGLRAQSLSSKLRNKVFSPMRMRLAESRNFNTSMEPNEVSRRTESHADISEGSTGRGRSLPSEGNVHSSCFAEPAKPRQARRKSAPSAPKRKSSRGRKDEAEASASIASAVTNIPTFLKPGEDIDYDNACIIYEKFWSDCQDCYILKNNPKKKLDIFQMENAPNDWTIRAMEPHGVDAMKNYLINMPDKSA
jgi:hypothetical protein